MSRIQQSVHHQVAISVELTILRNLADLLNTKRLVQKGSQALQHEGAQLQSFDIEGLSSESRSLPPTFIGNEAHFHPQVGP